MPSYSRKPYPERPNEPVSYPVENTPALPGHARPRSDDDIRRDVETALFYDNDVRSYDVHVEVHDGNVTLSGTVDSDLEIREAEEDVRAIPGVKQVSNNLRMKTAH